MIQVGDDVIGIFDSDGQTDHVSRNTRSNEVFVAQLRVGRAGRMDDQRFRIGNIRKQREQFQLVDPLDAGLLAALDAESEDRAGAFREVFVRKRLVFAIRQFRIIHPGNFRVVRQISDNLAGIFDMAFDAQ